MSPEEEVAIAKMSDGDMLKAQQAYDMVTDYFFGSTEKANMWFEVPNKDLQGWRPKMLLISGKIDKLLQYIQKNMVTVH